jgi:hypothetical protein
MIDQDTDRTKAIVICNISHRFLKQADDAMGALKESGGGTFDLFASLDRWGYPIIGRITAQLEKMKRKRKLDA